MIFSKIEYLNLLPFNIFLKRYYSLRFNKIANYKKSYPSKINQLFIKRKIDGAFISSIYSRHCCNKKCKCGELGIISPKEVLSVLIDINTEYKKDPQSDTSNMLAKILNLNGQIIIGDNALDIYFNKQNKQTQFIDIAKYWYDTYKLPFVFARLCYTSYYQKYKNISSKFKNKKIYIPYYILKRESLRVGISVKEVKFYLSKIEYKIDYKAQKSLKLFLKLSKKRYHNL